MSTNDHLELGLWLSELVRLSKVLELGDGCTAMSLAIRLDNYAVDRANNDRGPAWVVELRRGTGGGTVLRSVAAEPIEAAVALVVQAEGMLDKAIGDKRRELAKLERQARGTISVLAGAPHKCRGCDSLRHNPETGHFYCGNAMPSDCTRGEDG